MRSATDRSACVLGEVAVVTGGSRGIARSIARTLGASGATVVSLDLAPPAEADDCVAALYADVANEADVTAAFDSVVAKHGPIDILVNNAGLFSTLRRVPFWDMSVDEWDRVLQTNVRSVFLCCRAASASMRARQRGSIVNLASNSVSFGMGEMLHYVASKAAIVGMTRCLARELAPFGVTVNAVAPGLVHTDAVVQNVLADHRRRVAETQLLETPITADDVAGAVQYFCSPAARLITGQTLLVNGGATMGPI